MLSYNQKHFLELFAYLSFLLIILTICISACAIREKQEALYCFLLFILAFSSSVFASINKPKAIKNDHFFWWLQILILIVGTFSFYVYVIKIALDSLNIH